MNKLLFIDGNDIHQLYTALVFRKVGIGVEYLMTTDHAVQHYLKDDFQLVLIDLDLHGDAGYKLSRALRTIDPQVPIIGITDMVETKSMIESLHNGMNCCIERSKLLETLDACMIKESQKNVA